MTADFVAPVNYMTMILTQSKNLRCGLVHVQIKKVGTGRLGRLPAILYSFLSPEGKATYWILNSRLVTGTICQMLQALYEAPSAPSLPLSIESARDAKAKGSENILVFAQAGGSELTTAKCEIGTIPTSASALIRVLLTRWSVGLLKWS